MAGAAVGGVIAGNDGHRHNTGEGIAIGGVLGAVLGGAAASEQLLNRAKVSGASGTGRGPRALFSRIER